jgi:hypothetical protein
LYFPLCDAFSSTDRFFYTLGGDFLKYSCTSVKTWQHLFVDVTWKYEASPAENDEFWGVEVIEDLSRSNNKFNRNFSKL